MDDVPDEIFERREAEFWDEAEKERQNWLLRGILKIGPEPKKPTPDKIGFLVLTVWSAKRELAIAQKILERAPEDYDRTHAELNVRKRERKLKKAKTELATVEIEAKLLPAIEPWDEHKLAGVIAAGDLREQFDMVHADEEFVRAAARSALEKKTSEGALELAKEANRIAALANSIAKEARTTANKLAKEANENADMANVYQMKANEIARGANKIANGARWSWIAAFVSAAAAIYTALK